MFCFVTEAQIILFCHKSLKVSNHWAGKGCKERPLLAKGLNHYWTHLLPCSRVPWIYHIHNHHPRLDKGKSLFKKRKVKAIQETAKHCPSQYNFNLENHSKTTIHIVKGTSDPNPEDLYSGQMDDHQTAAWCTKCSVNGVRPLSRSKGLETTDVPPWDNSNSLMGCTHIQTWCM